MATIVSGTPATRTRHSSALGPLGFMVSMAIPAGVVVAGTAVEGFDAISWTGAAAWGAVATVVFTIFSMMGARIGMTDMDLLDLLGSTVAPPHSGQARAIGMGIHLMNGVVLAVGWAYGSLLVGWELNWPSALVWGAILWALALLMMSTMGAVHPAMRSGLQDDPGPAATNFGTMTPMGSLMGHLVWGAVLGLLYHAWPL